MNVSWKRLMTCSCGGHETHSQKSWSLNYSVKIRIGLKPRAEGQRTSAPDFVWQGFIQTSHAAAPHPSRESADKNKPYLDKINGQISVQVQPELDIRRRLLTRKELSNCSCHNRIHDDSTACIIDNMLPSIMVDFQSSVTLNPWASMNPKSRRDLLLPRPK